MTPRRYRDTSTDFERARREMVELQLRARGIVDERVLSAMAEVPRERFLPERQRSRAYRDGALDIGEGQTMSQPWIVASTASLLELTGHERVLDVGTGSGYGAAVLSRVAAEVVSIELNARLAARARRALEDLAYEVDVRVGNGCEGVPDRAPFGGIAVAATAEDAPPPALLDQLAPGAALVCPVRRGGEERLMRFRDGREEALSPVRFVALASDGAQR